MPRQPNEEWHIPQPSGNGDLPPIEDACDLCEEADDTPPEIVEGVFHQGSKIMFAGGSKSFKTWQLIQLAVTVSAGIRWLDKFITFKGRVLYLNFELPRWSMRKRIREVRAALGVTAKRGDLDVWNLRGHATSAETILPRVAQAAADRGYVLIIIDPLYKLLGKRDENSATDMSYIMNEVEQITVQTGAATSFGTHFSKGNQSAKNAIDRMSGSGVMARDPDSIIVCTEHEKKDSFTVNMILRNLPQQEPFTMTFTAPIMRVDDTLDPENLRPPAAPKKAKAGTAREEQILTILRLTKGSTVIELHHATGIANTTLKRDLASLEKQRKAFHSEQDSKWAIVC